MSPTRIGLILLTAIPLGTIARADAPEERALGYLAREVPKWSRENHCFSCHNNADGARALYRSRRGTAKATALADTTRWLAKPESWKRNGGDGPFSDKRLARIQFAAALADAVEVGDIKERTVLIEAANELSADQDADGSWAPDGPEALGSPATLGRPLATYTARETLKAADPARFRPFIAKADRFLAKLEPNSNLDAAVILLTSGPNDDRRRVALDWIRRGQSDEGGWGPFPDAPPEPFDTAVVLIALARVGEPAMVERGRAYLIRVQNEDGSWPETTRPAGGESYAQRVSTAAWATQALIETRKPGARKAD